MKEFIQGLFETSSERIKNPFIGSYITAFLVYNWRPVFLLLFSEATIEDKIVVINHEYCPKGAILWPLGIAIFYILILPYINLLFDYILSFSNAKKDERKRVSILNNLKHKKAEAKYEREIADERAGTSEVSELKDQIERLNTENEKLSKLNKESFDRYNESNNINENNIKDLKNSLLESEKRVDNLEKEKKQKQNTITKVTESLAKSFINGLPKDVLTYFKKYATHKLSTTKNKSMILNNEHMEKLKELDLIQFNSEKNTHILTDFGTSLYQFIQNNNI